MRIKVTGQRRLNTELIPYLNGHHSVNSVAHRSGGIYPFTNVVNESYLGKIPESVCYPFHNWSQNTHVYKDKRIRQVCLCTFLHSCTAYSNIRHYLQTVILIYMWKIDRLHNTYIKIRKANKRLALIGEQFIFNDCWLPFSFLLPVLGYCSWVSNRENIDLEYTIDFAWNSSISKKKHSFIGKNRIQIYRFCDVGHDIVDSEWVSRY